MDNSLFEIREKHDKNVHCSCNELLKHVLIPETYVLFVSKVQTSAALVDRLQLCWSSPRNDETIAKRPLNVVGAKHLNSLDGWSEQFTP